MSDHWTPHEGQRRAVEYLVSHQFAGLFADVGVGKTSSVLAAFSILKKLGFANRMLLIAPLRVCHLVWPYEIEKWIEFRHLRIEVLHGAKKDAALAREADIYVINPDGLDWLLGATTRTDSRGRGMVTIDLRKFKALGFDLLTIDELSAFKTTNTNRFKTIKHILPTFKRRWGLTATPAANGLEGLFGQVYCLDQGRTFGPYITHYRQKYFISGYNGFGWELRKGAEEEIYERMRPIVLRLAADDYVDMPDLVERVLRFDLPSEARRVYDALADDMIAAINDQVVVASNAAAASVKLRQVCNGGVYADEETPPALRKRVIRAEGREWVPLHDEKTDLLDNLVEELQGSPLLVAYDFHHDLARIQAWHLKRFKVELPYIGAGVSAKRSAELEAAWNRGELPVLAGAPASIGHGLNLQHAGNHVCWYGMTWNREFLDQFNGRVRRQGSKHHTVFVHYILARDTIDEVIYAALKGKARVQDALLEALRNRMSS